MRLFHVPQQIHERSDAAGLCDGLRVIGSPCEIPQRPGGGCFLVVRPKAYQRHESGKAPKRTNDTGRNMSADPPCTRGQCTRPARCDDPRALWINDQRVAMSMRGCGRAGSAGMRSTTGALRRLLTSSAVRPLTLRPAYRHRALRSAMMSISGCVLQVRQSFCGGKLAQREIGTIRAQVSTYFCTLLLTLFLPRRAAQRHIFRQALTVNSNIVIN